MDCDKFRLCMKSIVQNGEKEKNCISHDCISSMDNRKSIVAEENKKKYELINTERKNVTVFRVDGGMMKSERNMKCDNLLVVADDKIAIFVELKGVDLKHAFEQIDSIMTILDSGLAGFCMYARIVTSRHTNVPNIHVCPQYVALNKKIRRTGGGVKIQEKVLSERLDGF